MADNEHLKIFKQGTEAWNQWRRKNRGVQPDLSHADLRGANLRSANLNSANLSYANLEGANLGRAYLEAAELQGATPRGAHLHDADLGLADLRAMDLSGAQLWHARLEGADLREANVSAADLRFSDLTRADLRGCDLTGTNLTATLLLRTDLRDARLRQACLHGALLRECRLSGVDLSAAEMAATVLDSVDLSCVQGLVSVRHERASSIGTDTLDLTAAGLCLDDQRQIEVETFLRHAGVQENYLDLFRAVVDQPHEVYSVFIRYSFADRSFAERLYARIQGLGIRCWLNEHPMLPGEEFEEGFDLSLHPSDKLLLCCSEASLSGWWLAHELDQAAWMEHQQEKQRGRTVAALLAVNLDGYLASGKWKSSKAVEVRSRLVADFGGWEDDETAFERALDQVVKVLRRES